MTSDEGAAVIDAPGAPSVPDILVRVKHVAKAFGPTQALRNCSFELRAGEVHALAGENGSGKSTLVKILSGVHAPDSGRVEVAGAEVQLRSSKSAQQHGVVTVFQEVLVAEARSVLDNVWLGADDIWRTRILAWDKRRLAKAALEELFDRPVDLSTAMEDISLSARQACCIVRALLRRPRILILDEATSALDVVTRDRLFALIARLAADGVGVIFITHRMDEIEEIGDRITVMRSGETVASLSRGAWTPRQLVGLMTGAAELVTVGRPEKRLAATGHGAPVLSVRGLRLRPDGRPIDLDVHAGELIGLAGLEGHGQNEFLEALWGENVVAGEVIRHLPRRDVVVRSPVHAADCDIAYVPREILVVPGFVSARRYRLQTVKGDWTPSGHRYLSAYEIEGDPRDVMNELDKEVASGRMQLPGWFPQITFASFNCHAHGNPAEARLADHLYLVFSAPPEGLGNDEFVAWYREHADENTQVPGFLANWRFRIEPEVIDPTSATVATHLAIYEVDRDLATLRANLGAARVTNEAGWPSWFDPTPWTSLDANAIGDRVPAPAAGNSPERIPCPYAPHRPSGPITSAACCVPLSCSLSRDEQIAKLRLVAETADEVWGTQ